MRVMLVRSKSRKMTRFDTFFVRKCQTVCPATVRGTVARGASDKECQNGKRFHSAGSDRPRLSFAPVRVHRHPADRPKLDRIGERQISFARKLRAAGMLSEAGLRAVIRKR